MDHTKRFHRTLAGFGLTWHGGNRFSCFLEILETHFITKYLQIGPRASRLVLGFFWDPLNQIKPIHFPKNDTKQIYRIGLELMFMGFWQVGWVGNKCGTYPPWLSRHLTLQNLRNMNFLIIFSIFGGGGPRKVNDLLTSPINQFRDYFIRNRIEKLVPLNYRFPTDNKKSLK